MKKEKSLLVSRYIGIVLLSILCASADGGGGRGAQADGDWWSKVTGAARFVGRGIKEAADSVHKAIKEHPLTSLFLSTAVGVLLTFYAHRDHRHYTRVFKMNLLSSDPSMRTYVGNQIKNKDMIAKELSKLGFTL